VAPPKVIGEAMVERTEGRIIAADLRPRSLQQAALQGSQFGRPEGPEEPLRPIQIGSRRR
jgi:hypothetical protein